MISHSKVLIDLFLIHSCTDLEFQVLQTIVFIFNPAYVNLIIRVLYLKLHKERTGVIKSHYNKC